MNVHESTVHNKFKIQTNETYVFILPSANPNFSLFLFLMSEAAGGKLLQIPQTLITALFKEIYYRTLCLSLFLSHLRRICPEVQTNTHTHTRARARARAHTPTAFREIVIKLLLYALYYGHLRTEESVSLPQKHSHHCHGYTIQIEI